MQLTEKIETINQRLVDLFGIDTITGLAIWRVVWSEDQFEKRLGTYDDFTPSGIYIRTVTEVREAPKYRQWIKEKYVLERLVVVPEVSRKELPQNNISYEPMWVFQDKNNNYLPPKFEVCEIVVDTVYAAMGKKSLAKYKDPDAECVDPKIAVAKQRAKIDKLTEELFGDESSLGGSLIHGEGIVVPSNYEKMAK